MTSFQIKCIDDLKKNIIVAKTNCAMVTAQGVEFRYRVRGIKKPKLIAMSRFDAAQYLQERGKIHFVSITDSGIKLFIKTYPVEKGKCPPVFVEKVTELPWSKLTFTQEEVLNYAAIEEFKEKGHIMGLAPVYSINRPSILRIA